MPAIRLPFQSNPQEYREQGDDRLVNCFAEKIDGKAYRIRAWFGLVAVDEDIDDISVRGSIEVDGALYVVFEGGGVRKFTKSGTTITRTDLDYISGSGPVFMARNQRDSVEIGILTGLGRYYIMQDDVLSVIPLDDLPPFIHMTELGGYFFFGTADGRVFNSGLNDAKVIGGLDYFTAEGHPDGLVALFKNRLELVVMGAKSMEVWGLDSNPPATGSPLVRLGGAVFPRGCLVATGIAEIDNTFFWIGENRIVYRNVNYLPQRVSHYGVERSLLGEANIENIRCSSFSLGGNEFFVLNGTEYTWVFNAATGWWHELKSYGRERSAIEIYLAVWGGVYAFSKEDGNLYSVETDARLENGTVMPVVIRGMDLPAGLVCNDIEFDFVTGRAPITGVSHETNPVVELSWSDDGGATWKNPRTLSLGAQGAYRNRVRATRLGKTGDERGRRFELAISDPHVVAFTRAVLNEARA